ncbi:HlyD family efflux transporter periplasmic adaptor subunit [Hymenobacter negativus]|uniref:HlyD family secretion protein n=1 Tax=Hymenobacter negativus TaxID=2795026 RepID=A0ABS3QLL8_9BACT|nr:HlyD family efflux transporter periplasmic adaptor subunit [Hymenobacter negativus]MBO2012107.1 HlyD family secretion protein [Hymenobacter negativus]
MKNLFFSQGDYARQGQLLVTLSNHTFVTAPRAGFLGPNLLSIGQYISPLTPVTTISRHSYLVVLLLLPADWYTSIHTGDSVRVWATAPPARMANGTVGYIEKSDSTNVTVEIVLTSRAPFCIGELTWVRLQDKCTQVAVR